MLKFQGCAHFRQRLVCATLSGKKVKINDIRSEAEEPGLREYEVNFLRLLEKLTNGSTIDINVTGTVVNYTPGFIMGGYIEHDCGTKRAIGWFLEAIVALAPFSKKPMVIELKGITNDNIDVSLDLFRAVTAPLLHEFGVKGIELKIKRRGAPPNGGGEVYFRCPVVRELKPINFVDAGLVKRIRGTAYSTRVSPQTSMRIVDTARGILNTTIPDVFVYSDHNCGAESGNSPGFALSLVAETTTGRLIGAEAVAIGGSLPEDVAKDACFQLCNEIEKGGCIDTFQQPLVLLFMALCPEDVSKLRLGKLTPHSIEHLRQIRSFFGVTFKIRAEHETKTVMLSCLGSGYKNLSKKVT